MTCPVATRVACALALLFAAVPAVASAAGVQAGAAVLDGTYHVGSSSGQYASTRDGGYGDVDPHLQSVKNQASYGVQSRETVRALVVKGADGKYVAMVTDAHYIPQDALWRRTAQLLDTATGGLINEKNLTLSVSHNHSSPSYSSLDAGVWTFQDVFDYRFFDYYAKQNAAAVIKALNDMHKVRVGATASYFDAFQRNPMGPGIADDGSTDGFPQPYTDHDLSVVSFENIDDPAHPKPLANLFNIGQHPEMLEGYDLISGEWPEETMRFVDRTVGGVSLFSQNATGTSEVERDTYHDVHKRDLFDHVQYNQMEWAARQLSNAVIGDVNDIRAGRPNTSRKPTPYGGTSYASRFVQWMTDFPVAEDDRWFPGPVSHPYPGVSSCRTDPAFAGNPRIPVVGLPDCSSLTDLGAPSLPIPDLGLSTDTFEALGVPVPENVSAPSTGALEDTVGVHMQAIRMGPILFTVCSCEQWVDQAYNIKTRTDTVAGNEYLGYDATAPGADPEEKCTPNNDGTHKDDGSGTGTWTCMVGGFYGQSPHKISDKLIEHQRAQVLNDAARWDDPTCLELGCGLQAESEPTDLLKIRGNYTHDDTTVRGGVNQSADYAANRGYKLTVTMAMSNDYNGYIATYREFMDHDHYRKALTGWGPHSSDYYATRLSQMGHALAGDGAATKAIAGQTDAASAAPEWAPMVAKEVVDQAVEEVKVKAVGEIASAGVSAYAATIPDDGGSATPVVQPKSIQRFDATTFTWDGGNNYTDNPDVVVQRLVNGTWQTFADQSGEVPTTVAYPASSAGGFDPNALIQGLVAYRLGGQEWKWTASFEAFVSRFELIDAQGSPYSATPLGTYRFLVHGVWRKGMADEPYTRTSSSFNVTPWTGMTVNGLGTDTAHHVVFDAGPTHTIAEPRVRNTERPPIGPGNITFSIGPVDFPDTAADQRATGARFLNNVRGYSGQSMSAVEHYCLDCSFRPWMDATDSLTARVTVTSAHGATTEEVVQPDAAGHFVSKLALAPGDRAQIRLSDAWGDRPPAPVTYTVPAGSQ